MAYEFSGQINEIVCNIATCCDHNGVSPSYTELLITLYSHVEQYSIVPCRFFRIISFYKIMLLIINFVSCIVSSLHVYWSIFRSCLSSSQCLYFNIYMYIVAAMLSIAVLLNWIDSNVCSTVHDEHWIVFQSNSCVHRLGHL